MATGCQGTASKQKGLQVAGSSLVGGTSLHPLDLMSAASVHTPSPKNPDTVEQVASINRRLVQQIETLRLKVDVDARVHESSRTKMLVTSDRKLQTRELEIEHLKTNLRNKEMKVKTLTKTNQEKVAEMERLQIYINDLKEDVRASKDYADDIQGQLKILQKEKSSLQSGEAYSQKDLDIQALQKEVSSLTRNLNGLDKELAKAKDTISQQGGKLRIVEKDRNNTQLKFQEDLAKVRQSMRFEVEKIRDIMKRQWDEMRELRVQNEDMRSDIREIKDLLVTEMKDSNMTRVYGHAEGPFNLLPMAPSLSSQRKDPRRIQTGRKKT